MNEDPYVNSRRILSNLENGAFFVSKVFQNREWARLFRRRRFVNIFKSIAGSTLTVKVAGGDFNGHLDFEKDPK